MTIILKQWQSTRRDTHYQLREYSSNDQLLTRFNYLWHLSLMHLTAFDSVQTSAYTTLRFPLKYHQTDDGYK